MRAVHHRACRLVVAVRGQAVHKKRVGFGQRHQRVIHLIATQLVVPPFACRLRIMHADPRVGDHQIGALNSLLRVALNGIQTIKCLFGVQRLRPGKDQFEVELFGRMGKAREDVVAVA